MYRLSLVAGIAGAVLVLASVASGVDLGRHFALFTDNIRHAGHDGGPVSFTVTIPGVNDDN